MKRRNPGLLLIFVLCMVLLTHPTFAQSCISLSGNSVTLDGIVVGTAIVGGGGLPAGCSVDPAWAGVLSHDFAVFGAAGTHQARIFITGYNASADATLDNVYVAVHIEGDSDFRENDKLVLYFDANNSGAWDGSDFALYFEIGPSTPAPSTAVCNQTVRLMTVYEYSGGYWVEDLSVPAGAFSSRISWDYDISGSDDPESEIWELEININLGLLGLSVSSSGSAFKVGGKLYIHEPTGGGDYTVWRWPSGLTAEQNPSLYDPNEGSVTPASLEQITIGNCANVAFSSDGSSGITATDAYGNSNKFTRLTSSNFNPDGSSTIQNHFTAKVKFFNPSNLSDNSSVAVPNTGKVKFMIRPWNSGFLGSYTMGEPAVSFDHLNQEKTVQLDWPQNKNQYDNPSTHQPKNDLDASAHSCLQVEIKDFNININESSDIHYRNLTYISTSTVHDTFLISAVGIEPPAGSNTLEYILRVVPNNISDELLDPKFKQLAYKTGSTTTAVTGALPTAGAVIADLPFIPSEEKWNFTFDNAEQIGLKPLGNGYFSLPIGVREKKLIAVSITGGKMPAKADQYILSPRAGGTLLSMPSGEPPLEISVKPGKMVTIVSHGLINVDPQNREIKANGPNGFAYSDWTDSKFLLPSDYYDPSENVGAIIASFDNFKTSFVIGADRTFIVPEKATKLSLAVNDINGEYGMNSGTGFEINVITSEPLFLPTRLASQGNPDLGLPAMPPEGSNLPAFQVNAYQVVEYGGEEEVRLLKPTGYVAYAAYASHPRRFFKPFEVVAFAGWTIFGDTLGLNDGIVVGGKLGYRLINQLVFEIEGGVTLTDNISGVSGKVIQAMGNLRYELPLGLLTPYATAGAGYAIFRGFGVDDEALAIQGGIGATLKLNNSFGLRAEGRMFRIGDVWNVGTTSNYQITGGFVYWF